MWFALCGGMSAEWSNGDQFAKTQVNAYKMLVLCLVSLLL